MRMLEGFAAAVTAINRGFARVASALVLLVVAVVVLAIVGRQLGIVLLWPGDVAQIAFVWLVFLSLGPALQSGHHVTVELFEPLVPRVLRRRLDIVAALACLVFGIVFLFQLWALTSRSIHDGRMAVMAIPVALKWVQIAGPVGLAQFCLTAALHLLTAILRPGHGRAAQAGH